MFVDVGANTGIYTLKAGQIVGENGVVLAMEPFPNILSDLFDNVRMNRLNNVRVRGVCAADKSGTDVFWTNFDKPNSFSLKCRDSQAHAISVMKMSLDDLFVSEKIERCDYIKIDAEGSEADIIAGASGLIKKFHPIIQAEITISEGNFVPEGYLTFQAKYPDGGMSPNRLFIPAESRYVTVANNLCVRLG